MAEGFGDYLRRELRARKWTVRYCALRSGVDHSTISRLLQGQRVPKLATAWRISEALDGAPFLPATGVRNAPNTDARQRLGDALRQDRGLDRGSVELILNYYEAVRSRSGPPRL